MFFFLKCFFRSNLFLQLSAVPFPHGGGISLFKCLLTIRSARGLMREEDEVHRLKSTVSALFSTYESLNEKNEKSEKDIIQSMTQATRKKQQQYNTTQYFN